MRGHDPIPRANSGAKKLPRKSLKRPPPSSMPPTRCVWCQERPAVLPRIVHGTPTPPAWCDDICLELWAEKTLRLSAWQLCASCGQWFGGLTPCDCQPDGCTPATGTAGGTVSEKAVAS